MKIKLITLLLVMGVISNVNAADLVMKSPSVVDTPAQIKGSLSSEVLGSKTIDVDGDGKLDFIIEIKNDASDEPYAFDLWYSSSYKLIKKVPKYNMDYDFLWFVNLDEDPEPEIVAADGYSDGIDYSIYDQNLEDGSTSLLFRFNPVLIDDSNKQKDYYWGYPWDISNIIIRSNNGVLQVKCSLRHGIARDGEIDTPEWQKMLPAIFFEGKSTQPNIQVGKIDHVQWLTVKEIIAGIKK